MHIEGPKTTVQKSQEEIFHFLTQVGNYEKIMPDNIQKFEVLSENSFLFQLKGMPEIGLQLQKQEAIKRTDLVSIIKEKLSLKNQS